MAPTFDFLNYLHHRTHIKDLVLEELTGGSANHTVRIRRGRSSSNSIFHQGQSRKQFSKDGNLEDSNIIDISTILSCHGSLVFKQAPPFLAKVPTIPFSSFRQVVEAEALHLLHSPKEKHPCGMNHILRRNPNIAIPELVYLDKVENVLIQTDLGPHPSLYDFLVGCDTSIDLASEAGRIIGGFLAEIHNASYVSNQAPAVSKNGFAIFQNDDAESVLENAIMLATSHMKDAGISDYEILGKRAAYHWKTREKTVFAQGDLWFGTLLMNVKKDSETVVAIGICDWEFAGLNDPAADIAQLGSYLHLLSLSPKTTPKQSAVIFAFAGSLYKVYFSISNTAAGQKFLRSLLIMHGWEMINAAGWSSRQYMWCNCSGHGVRCSHIKEMVVQGAALLRTAGTQGDLGHADCNIAWWSHFLGLANPPDNGLCDFNQIKTFSN